jgi:hypothetical protein
MAFALSNDLPNHVDLPRRSLAIGVLTLIPFLVAFVCFVAGARLAHSARGAQALRWLIVPILLWAGIGTAQSLPVIARELVATASGPTSYQSDAMYYNHYDAQLVLRGKNPYADDDLASAMRQFGILGYTPITRGRFDDPAHPPTVAEMDAVGREYLSDPAHPPTEIDPRTLHSYPAGAILVSLPSVWAGLPSIGLAQLLLFLSLGVGLVVFAPGWSRPVVALILLSDPDAVRRVAEGDFDVWWVALLACAWLLRDRRIASGLLLGAACAIKQTAWFAAPFYLVYIWRVYGPREAARCSGIALAGFLALNLPWLLIAPREWLTSLTLPMSLSLFPEGKGAIALALSGAPPLPPSWVFGILELIALGLALTWYWGACRAYAFAGLPLTFLPLVFAWRSPERYFALLPVMALVALILTLRAHRQQDRASTGGVLSKSPLEGGGERAVGIAQQKRAAVRAGARRADAAQLSEQLTLLRRA